MEAPIKSILKRKGGEVFAVTAKATVTEAVHLMNEKNIGAVAIMEGDELLGIFTERDVLRRVIDGGLNADTTPVSEVMTKQLAFVRPESSVGEAMAVVNAKGCRHLPVMEGSKLVGIISTRDLINAVLDGQEHQITELMQYISGGYGAPQVPVQHGSHI